MLTLRNSIIGFLLILAAGLSGWSMFISSQSQISVVDNEPNRPDAYMENVTTTILNKLGSPVLTVSSPKLLHYANNDTTELTTPHVIVYREATEPWHITANHGKATQGLTQITFWENVVIHHLADKENPITTMHTTSLTVLPDEEIAKTTDAVDVLQPYTNAHGIGMLANWHDGTVKLLSQAREEYVPNS